MNVVIANKKVIFAHEMDDVAWDTRCELVSMGVFSEDEIYCEEVYEDQFDEDGKCCTTEGDVITLEECRAAEDGHLVDEYFGEYDEEEYEDDEEDGEE